MAIQFDKEKNIFTLESKKYPYQIMIGDMEYYNIYTMESGSVSVICLI